MPNCLLPNCPGAKLSGAKLSYYDGTKLSEAKFSGYQIVLAPDDVDDDHAEEEL